MVQSRQVFRDFRFFLLALVAIASSGIPLVAGAEDVADIDHQEVIIWSEGVRLAGDVFSPSGLDVDEKVPGILLVTGWGGSKENLAKNYAPQFARAGFIVLVFDFKGWGESVNQGNGDGLGQIQYPGKWTCSGLHQNADDRKAH